MNFPQGGKKFTCDLGGKSNKTQRMKYYSRNLLRKMYALSFQVNFNGIYTVIVRNKTSLSQKHNKNQPTATLAHY